MKVRTLKLAALTGSVFICLGLPAIGQEDATVQFTGGYSSTFSNSDSQFGAGIYTSNLTVNGATSSPGIICDDFKDEITPGQTWNAYAYQASSLTSSNIGETMFGSSIGVTGYAEVATLVSMLFGNQSFYGSITGISQSEIASAIWYLTDPSVSGLDSKALSLVAAVNNAFGNNASSAQAYLASLTNLWILTPNPMGQGEPQEMWTAAVSLSVPEGGAAFMYLLLAGVTCFGAMLLRSKRQFPNAAGA
jgi:hypothetical protein